MVKGARSDLSRRQFLTCASAATALCSLPILRGSITALAKQNQDQDGGETLSGVGSRYAVKEFGANIRFWTFDKNARTRASQIRQVKRWGFTKLRTNEPCMYLDVYDINHAAMVAYECLAEGIEWTICPVSYTPSVEAYVTPQQYGAIATRYNNRVFDIWSVICTLGIGLNMPAMREHLLGVVQFMRDRFPQGTRMQAFNGPELEGYSYWNLYSAEFRNWAQSHGFPVEEGEGVTEVIRNNYLSFMEEAKGIWGDPFLSEGSHHYAWSEGVAHVGLSPYVTEFGVNRSEFRDVSRAWEPMPNDIINYNARNGLESTSEGQNFNVLEMFVHSATDPRFLDLWLRENGTKPLWKASSYRSLLRRSDSSRNTWNEFDAVMMDSRVATVITRMSRRLRGV